VDRAGTTYHVSVRVVDADSGTVLAAERAVARGDDDVIPVVDRLMRAVRQQLGERAEAIAPTRPFAEVATPSFAAYQRYRRGQSRFRAGDQLGAMREWGQAVTLDSGFASAWSALGNAYTNWGDRAKAREALDSALAHADRLTDMQRSVLEVLRARLSYDYIIAAELLRRHVNLYGPSEWGLGMLADALASMGRMEEAISVAEELERSPPPFGFQSVVYANHVRWLAALGRIDEASEEARHLSGAGATRMGARIAVQAGDWAKADSLATILLRDSDEPRRQILPLEVLASVSATRGQVGRAMDQLRQAANTDGTELREPAQRAYGAMLILAVVSGATLAPRELRGIRADAAPGGTLVALWLAASGDTARAWKQLSAVRALPADQRTRFDTALVLCEAWLVGARGHTTTVVSLLRPVVNGRHVWDPPVNQLMRWTLAQAFDRTGQPDSAAAWLERIAQWGGQVWGGEYGGDNELRGFSYSFVHFRLGRLLMQLGKDDEAKQHYATFLESFTQPDPEYAWMVTEARAKLEELARGR
jgi:tetratricopeptide (TPR) repeat protein